MQVLSCTISDAKTKRQIMDGQVCGDSPRGPLSHVAHAKNYLERNRIDKMFQSLIAALMIERPDDHFEYLDAKLEEVREKGLYNIDWDTFVYDLHPERNAQRLQLIQEDHSGKCVQEIDTDHGDYEPKLFKLTESHQ